MSDEKQDSSSEPLSLQAGVVYSADNELIRWVLRKRISVLLMADISMEAKREILNSRGYSSVILD
tara:strand:+ start:92 stop:286 length:195 start_codon:yes stop_codon:yes gene_type:complete